MSVTTIVAADSFIVTEGLAAVVKKHGVAEVLATTVDADKVPLLVQQHSPSIVLLGFEPVSLSVRVAGEISDVPSIVLSWAPEGDDVLAALRGGVRGFLIKDVSPAQLAATVAAVLAGCVSYPQVHLSNVAAFGATARPDLGATGLTPREQEIIQLLAEGMSTQQIAQRLGIASQTVKNHVGNAMRKVGVHSRLQLSAWANRGSRQGGGPS